MCGIVVAIGLDKGDVHDMLDVINHRGNDNRTIKKVDRVVFGHNRLSINDVSSLGNQPMFGKDGKFVLVVNGEIWNYPQLRKEYESRGHSFESRSDSEIILHLYEEDELKRMDGMFSFVIYDSTKSKLIVSRDWVGKTPLYIHNNTVFVIASEMKSILEKLPDARCNFVPKNSLIEINLKNGKIDMEKDYYFKFSQYEKDTTYRQSEVNDKTYRLLDNAVNKRLLSDVKIATCLSGGIDSSVITYLLSKHIPDIVSYTVKFDDESRDLMFARLVAKHLGVELVEVEIPRDKDLLKQRFMDTIRVIEYPSSVQVECGILQSFVAEQMKKDGVKVAFSGEGSDESYGSYGMIRMFSKKPDWSDIRKKLFEKQYYGNLLRGNNIFMNYGTIELRCPFFDTDFLDFTTNLPNEVLSKGYQWKLPLAESFRPYLPDDVCDQEKRAFQTGTNFKGYIEDLILNDKSINFKNRRRPFDCISDNFRKIFGFSHREMKGSIIGTEGGLYKWV